MGCSDSVFATQENASSSTPPISTNQSSPVHNTIESNIFSSTEEEISEVHWNLEYMGEEFDLEIPGFTLKGHKMIPEGEVKFIYIFLHGLAYSLVFNNDFYPFITKMGGVVYACDHLGHGKSPGSRVTLEIKNVLDEIKNLLAHAKSEYPNVPVILHGHSMGGLSSLSFILRNKQNILSLINGVILDAPWISDFPQFHVGCGAKAIVGCFNCACPSYEVYCENDTKPMTEPVDGIDYPSWINIRSNCKYFCKGLTGKIAHSAFNEIEFVRETRYNYNEKLPMLFIHGKKDGMVSYEGNEEFAMSLIERFPNANITFKGFENGTHCLLKCKERKTALNIILPFIEEVIG